jgi:hypothetical protein
VQLDDLDGDVLTIARGTSNEVVGPTKTGRTRRLTLGATTAALWRDTPRTGNSASPGHRLGRRDASTTLRIYARALPLTDAADTLDRLCG